MPEPTSKPFVLQGAPRAELARLCRQICLAREQGTMSPVTAEEEFLLALTTVRATYGTASINETDLKDIVTIEESRVADAVVIAELIATRINAQQTQTGAQPSTFSQAQEDTSPPLPTPIPFPSSASTPPLSIADLIEGMLTQERRDVRKPS